MLWRYRLFLPVSWLQAQKFGDQPVFLLFISLFWEVGGYKYQYEGQASGQLTQQETLALLATRVLTCNLLASLRPTAQAQMTQNILTQTDRRIFLKSLLEVESFH